MADERPHSRACGIRVHDHGTDCHTNCPTCHGRVLRELDASDSPEPLDVLRRHQLAQGWVCTCGTKLRGVRLSEALAEHQLLQLQLAGLAVVSVHGTAAVVAAAAAVVGAMAPAWSIPAHALGGRSLTAALDQLRTAVEAMGR